MTTLLNCPLLLRLLPTRLLRKGLLSLTLFECLNDARAMRAKRQALQELRRRGKLPRWQPTETPKQRKDRTT